MIKALQDRLEIVARGQRKRLLSAAARRNRKTLRIFTVLDSRSPEEMLYDERGMPPLRIIERQQLISAASFVEVSIVIAGSRDTTASAISTCSWQAPE